MCETGRTGKSAYRTARCVSRNPPGVPVLHVKVCYATCVAVSFSLSSCLDRISQQSHLSRTPPMYRPTANPPRTPINLLKLIIGPWWMFPYPDEKALSVAHYGYYNTKKEGVRPYPFFSKLSASSFTRCTESLWQITVLSSISTTTISSIPIVKTCRDVLLYTKIF